MDMTLHLIDMASACDGLACAFLFNMASAWVGIAMRFLLIDTAFAFW